MSFEKTSRTLVQGYLKREGNKVVNGNGEEILLTGLGIGNWLLPEGYMWLSKGCSRFDRPRRIEAVVKELTGKAYADSFWNSFRENYITEKDIEYIAKLGYNSVRIPLLWRLFMEEGEGIEWKDYGFTLLDQCIDWCEKHKLYAFIDLHGAPGGQTGANIDDCIDDVPRLFTDQDSWDKTIALWVKIADRYKDRWIVGGYDLLNEPIRPKYVDGRDFDHLFDRLRQFYIDVIDAIRKVDKLHLFSIEGHHWSTNTAIFDRIYDENMVIHFHRYGCKPDITAFTEFLELSEKWNLPLWLGETGENCSEWFAALYSMSINLDIGYNLWPYKKMDCTNSPLSIKQPRDWDIVIDYAKGGPHPGYHKARLILDELLDNIRIENCNENLQVSQAALRKPGCTVLGIDFDELPGVGKSYQYNQRHLGQSDYRANTYMEIAKKESIEENRFVFDSKWDENVLRLNEGEFVCYGIQDIRMNQGMWIHFSDIKGGELTISQEDQVLSTVSMEGLSKETSYYINLRPSEYSSIRIDVVEGKIELNKLVFTVE